MLNNKHPARPDGNENNDYPGGGGRPTSMSVRFWLSRCVDAAPREL
jgi:hypothetical protein